MKDPMLAGILSFLLPGLGQVYCSRVSRGILFFIVACGGYFVFILPGVIVHIISIIDAVSEAKKTKVKK